MKKLGAAVCAALLCAPLFAQAGGVNFSGTVETLWGVSFPWTDGAGDFTVGDTSFTGTVDAYWGESSALADGTVGYDALTQELYFSLNELYVDYAASFWGIRMGRQKAAWGKADGVTITNVICPQDMGSFSALTGDGALGVDALRLSANGERFTLDAWWIPFFRGTRLPLEEGNPLRTYIAPATVDFPVAALGKTLSLPVTIGTLSRPELNIKNGEYALKASGYFSLCDVSVYGFYGWDDMPLLDYTLSRDGGGMPSAITITGGYERMAMVGADAAFPIGEVVLRAEAAFFPQRHFQKSAQAILTDAATAAATGGSYSTSEKRNELCALVGLDWMPNGWTLTAQYFCDAVFGSRNALEREDAYTHGATASVSKSVLNETLELSFAGMVNFAAFDSALTFTAEYSLSDQITLGCGVYLFLPGPNEDGEYGAYKDLSCGTVTARFSF